MFSRIINVLLVEDDEDDYVLTQEKLEEVHDLKVDLHWAENYDEGLNLLSTGKYDICLLDYRLGSHTGVQLLEEAIQQGCQVPIILLTGQEDRDIDIAAMSKGAADYLIKGQIDPPQLERSIRYALKQAEALERIRDYARQLETANRDLESFSYSVSHDLRAPLRAIGGFSRVLLDKYADEMPDEAQRYLHIVRDNIAQMGQLVDDLLEFSRTSRSSLRKRTLNLEALVQEVYSSLQPEWENRRVEFTVYHLAECQGDFNLIKQLLTNLIGNALKYSRPRDPAAIEIGCEHSRGENIYFIKDNGVGFDMRYADKLFSVFQRLHRHDEFEGTGVGLAIVQRIIERHGGRIWVESVIDEGTCFYFTLE